MISNQEKALKQIREALADLMLELSKSDQELVAARTTLNSFRRQLETMAANIETTDLPLIDERRGGMGRVIVESWPLTNPLGQKIIGAEHAYFGL